MKKKERSVSLWAITQLNRFMADLVSGELHISDWMESEGFTVQQREAVWHLLDARVDRLLD